MIKLFLAAIIFLTTIVVVNAQSKDETALTMATEQLRNALIDADKAVLENLTATKLSYGHSGGYIDDKKEFVEKLVTGKSDFVSIDLSDQIISVSGNTAIVRHILKATTLDAGKPTEVHLRVLLIWQKQKGHWKLLARQAVRVV